MRLIYIKEVQTSSGAHLRVKAQPNGWLEVWGGEDMEIIRQYRHGPYRGTVEHKDGIAYLSDLYPAETWPAGEMAQLAGSIDGYRARIEATISNLEGEVQTLRNWLARETGGQ